MQVISAYKAVEVSRAHTACNLTLHATLSKNCYCYLLAVTLLNSFKDRYSYPDGSLVDESSDR